MARLHLQVLASLATALAGFVPACSDDGRAASQPALDAGPDARRDATTPVGGDAGSGNGGAPGRGDGSSAGEGNGGPFDSGSGATSNGDGGRQGSAGGTSTGVDAGCETIDAPDGAVDRELSLCDRLRDAPGHSFDVTRAYDHAVYQDCRVAWVIDLYLKDDLRADFLNALLAWNMRFWGCTAPAPADFALIFKPAPLSTGDVTALIDDYIGVVTPALDLSDLEIADMRAALGVLARPLIADASCTLSRSRCETGAGGAGSVDAGGGGGSGSGGDTGSGGGSGSGGVSGSGGGSGSGGVTGSGGDLGSGGARDAGVRLDAGTGGRDAQANP